MQRITISIDDTLAGTFDAMAGAKGYSSRSEAVRDVVRNAVEEWRLDTGLSGYCVATFSYVYDRRVRQLAKTLAELEHEHHNLVVASTSMRLDHNDSLVSVVLKGECEAVKGLVDRIAAQRGVRVPNAKFVSVRANDHHASADSHEHHGHEHLSPLV